MQGVDMRIKLKSVETGDFITFTSLFLNRNVEMFLGRANDIAEGQITRRQSVVRSQITHFEASIPMIEKEILEIPWNQLVRKADVGIIGGQQNTRDWLAKTNVEFSGYFNDLSQELQNEDKWYSEKDVQNTIQYMQALVDQLEASMYATLKQKIRSLPETTAKLDVRHNSDGIVSRMKPGYLLSYLDRDKLNESSDVDAVLVNLLQKIEEELGIHFESIDDVDDYTLGMLLDKTQFVQMLGRYSRKEGDERPFWFKCHHGHTWNWNFLDIQTFVQSQVRDTTPCIACTMNVDIRYCFRCDTNLTTRMESELGRTFPHMANCPKNNLGGPWYTRYLTAYEDDAKSLGEELLKDEYKAGLLYKVAAMHGCLLRCEFLCEMEGKTPAELAELNADTALLALSGSVKVLDTAEKALQELLREWGHKSVNRIEEFKVLQRRGREDSFGHTVATFPISRVSSSEGNLVARSITRNAGRRVAGSDRWLILEQRTVSQDPRKLFDNYVNNRVNTDDELAKLDFAKILQEFKEHIAPLISSEENDSDSEDDDNVLEFLRNIYGYRDQNDSDALGLNVHRWIQSMRAEDSESRSLLNDELE